MSSCANPSCQMTIKQCLEALDKMKRQMEIILPHLPPDVRNNLANCAPPNAQNAPNKTGFTKIIAAKQNADGSFTKMFALKRDFPEFGNDRNFSDGNTLQNASNIFGQDRNMAFSPSQRPQRESDCSVNNSSYQNQQNASRIFTVERNMPLSPRRDGAETLARLRSRVEERLGCTIQQPADDNDPIGELEEMQGPQRPVKRTFALFATVNEAEEFLMVTINQIVTMFSKIAEMLKEDSINCLKDIPKDKSFKQQINEKCVALLLDLEYSMREPINKLKEEWIGRFKAVVPELNFALCNIVNFQDLEIMNNRSIARQEAMIEARIEAAALGHNEPATSSRTPSQQAVPK